MAAEDGDAGLSMELEDLISNSLAVDLETKGERIYRIGALCGNEQFERKGRFAPARALAELDRLAEKCRFLLGHNLLGFDLPLLRRLYPDLELLRKPVIDTLYLSPLAFPQNPYHRLVKDYKLVRDALNDPIADARLALSLFRDQWQSFADLARTDRVQVLSLYRFCLQKRFLAVDSDADGFDAVFAGLRVPAIDEDAARALFCSLSAGCA
ncbi:MAG: hypothetical protein RBS57_10570, partial [Desulforhabdus sp.]|nr:hypothetical protein [Desulforhabdus sp.]